MIKIFFLGTPNIAVPALQKLAANPDVEIVGVGVFSDKRVGRKKILTPCHVKKSALELGLPIYEIENKKKLVQVTHDLDFDLGIVVAFGMIFPAEILEQHFFVNVHFSLLPAWRGASPVQSAILAGQKESGITWQRMVYALDAGNILLQKKYDIIGKNTAEIWHDFAHKTAESWRDFFEQLSPSDDRQRLTQVPADKDLGSKSNKFYGGVPQLASAATLCGKFQKTDGRVNPATETAQTLYRKFLAFTPWPGIYVETNYGNVKILSCQLTADPERKFLAVPCKEGSYLWVETVQLAGKKPMNVQALLNGRADVFVARP